MFSISSVGYLDVSDFLIIGGDGFPSAQCLLFIVIIFVFLSSFKAIFVFGFNLHVRSQSSHLSWPLEE